MSYVEAFFDRGEARLVRATIGWGEMAEAAGLSVGATRFAGVQQGGAAVTRQSVLTLYHQRPPELGVPGENPYKPVKGRRYDGIRLAVEYRPFCRNDRYVHQAVAIFLACATTSSMPPCI